MSDSYLLIMLRHWTTVLLIGFFTLLITNNLYCQIIPPYTENFDGVNAEGWSHYSLFGSDDWELGVPSGLNLNDAASGANVWGTNLDGNITSNSFMCLETPEFDFSGTTHWVLTFSHEYYTYTGAGGNIEYSIDGGVTWILLNGATSEKRAWYNADNLGVLGQECWSGSYYSSGFKLSSHDLEFLMGQPSVKFRFKFGTGYYTYEGWIIDDFKIQEEYNNIYALNGDVTHASQYFETFNVNTPVVYEGIIRPAFQNTVEYYFSRDEIFDENDSLIGTKVGNMNSTAYTWEKTFNMIPNLNHGDYYIFKKLDAVDVFAEFDENDNISYSILRVDSTFISSYKDDFESDQQYWNTYAKSAYYNYIGPGFWTYGNNELHHIFGSDSGNNAWYINETGLTSGNDAIHFVESPFLDLRDTANYTFCFWYKLFSKGGSANNITVQYTNEGEYPFYSSSYSGNNTIVNPFRVNDWDCSCTDISNLSGKINAKVRVGFRHSQSTSLTQLIVIDDVYIGEALPDIKIRHNNIRTINNLISSDTLFYTLFNSGLLPAETSSSGFYWSTDSVWDSGDVYLGSNSEPTITETNFVYRSFGFNLPTQEEGNYYIIAIPDINEEITEMWEDDYSAFEVKLQNTVQVPYFNDFEEDADGWFHERKFGEDQWTHGHITGMFLDSTVLGNKSLYAYSTDSVLADQSLMMLYTPTFDLTGVNNPVLSFDMEFEDRYEYQNSGIITPFINLSYSYDNGATWHVLDTTNQSFKTWYYYMYYDFNGGVDKFRSLLQGNYYLFETQEPYFANSHLYHGRDSRRIYEYIIDIDTLRYFETVQFRYNLTTLPNNMGKGIIIDNFSIEDRTTDLTIEYYKDLIKSPLSDYLSVVTDICNNGNYISDTAYVNFYLSEDQFKDESDILCGRDYIPPIRPECCYNLNYLSEDTLNLIGYNYLIMDIDEENNIPETNTENNVISWKMSPAGITDYPYFMEFEDTVFDGWSYYSYRYSWVLTRDRWRIRSYPSENEPLYITGIVAGELFTDPCNGTITHTPRYNLESPNFNFTNLENIRLSFDFLCFPGTGYGGNVSYSTNGGQSWTILFDQYGDATNWYSQSSSIQYLSNEPGWTGGYQPWSNRSINVSFLEGQPSVVFKIQFIAHGGNGGSLDGMRIDNFSVTGDTIIISQVKDYNLNSVSVFPNPASDIINIQINNSDNSVYSISISDLSGKTIFDEKDIQDKLYKVNCIDLLPGYYLINLSGDINITKGIVIQ